MDTYGIAARIAVFGFRQSVGGELTGLVIPSRNSQEGVRYFTLCPPVGSSYGAPVPDEPRNNLRPSAKVISLPFALCDPSLDW